MKVFKVFLLFVLIMAYSGCEKDELVRDDYKDILENIGYNVILATYAELDAQTLSLASALEDLEVNPTGENLEKARQAWRNARVPWEQSEGFLFGPVDQQGIDPSIDSWPVNQPDLEAVLASPNVLTKAYIDGLDGTLKGFHTIEYLIFGAQGTKDIPAFNAREFEYLRACSQSLEGATRQLYYTWKPDHQNFIANVVNAGQTGFTSVYPSQKAALEEIVNGLVVIADEVANGKINDPLSQQNIHLEESRFSVNSKQDFADNIKSIKNAYEGSYKTTDGKGITDIIALKNIGTDTKVRQQIDAAIEAIESIDGTFTTAIFDARPSVQNAQQKVRDLQLTLESEVLPIISNL
ncbi:MAG: imelysin family protein [Saprospiraceae bacterium]